VNALAETSASWITDQTFGAAICRTTQHIDLPPSCLRHFQHVLKNAGHILGRFYLGISVRETGGCRQIRKWIAEDARIPYSAWALLCHAAGFGTIWINEAEAHTRPAAYLVAVRTLRSIA
jgi:hypothetical protein